MEIVHTGHLEVVHMYLFGGVKYLRFLLTLMGIDIITGVFKAIKNKNLWSRKAFFGYKRKVLVLLAIITSNIIDQILNLEGVLVFATMMFYIANEVLSITENFAELDVLVPPIWAEKLLVIRSHGNLNQAIDEELAGKNVNKQVKEGSAKNEFENPKKKKECDCDE